MDKIYLDYNATTPIAPEVLEAMLPYFKEKFYNPSSMYSKASEVQADVKNARKFIAQYLGAKSEEEIIFTGSSTEATNFALRGAVKLNSKKNHIITSAVEHSAVLETCKDLERDGYSVTYVGVNKKGELNETEFLEAINDNTAIISIMHANSETGVIFPIERLAKLAKEKNPNVLFHSDATQTTGKLLIDLNANFKNVDLLSTSAHKIYAPKGVGLVYIRKGVKLRKYMTGGHQEYLKRAGTINVPYIIGFAKAFEVASNESLSDHQRLKNLRDKIEKILKEKIPYMYVNGEGADRIYSTTNLAFDCIEGESILYTLDQLGFCVSSGSACTSGTLEPSHVLRAMNVPKSAAHSSLRVSLGRYTTEAEVDSFISKVPEVVYKLRDMSPFWDRVNNKPNEALLKL